MIRSLLWFALLLLTVSCVQKSKQSESATPSSVSVPSKAGSDLLQITKVGDNFKPAFNDKEDEILFLSGDRSSHRRVEAYAYSIQERREHRLTFSSGRVTAAVGWNSKYYFISDTEAIKESPLIFRESVQTSPPSELSAMESQLADVFEWNRETDELERLTEESDSVRYLRAGKSTIYWTQGPILNEPKARVLMRREDGYSAISFLPVSMDIQANLDRQSGWWAWAYRASKSSDLKVKVRNPSGEIVEVPLSRLRHDRVQDFQLYWWSYLGSEVLLIQRQESDLTFSLWGYLVKEKCLRKIPIEWTQPLESVVPAQEGSRFLIVAGVKPNRQIYLSEANTAAHIGQYLLEDEEKCGLRSLRPE